MIVASFEAPAEGLITSESRHWHRLRPEVYEHLCSVAGHGDEFWWRYDDLTLLWAQDNYDWGWEILAERGPMDEPITLAFHFADKRHATYFKLLWGGK